MPELLFDESWLQGKMADLEINFQSVHRYGVTNLRFIEFAQVATLQSSGYCMTNYFPCFIIEESVVFATLNYPNLNREGSLCGWWVRVWLDSILKRTGYGNLASEKYPSHK